MYLFDYVNLELLVKLIVSALLGLIIGLERELKRKPLGLKTSLVISITSCLITIVSIESAYSFPERGEFFIRMDPLRLAAQIVSGIGFLGAGVILKKENSQISGLTTAAMIWGAAGIGIAVGAGFYLEATFGVLLLLFSLELLPVLLWKYGPRSIFKKEMLLKISIKKLEGVDQTITCLQNEKILISQTKIKDIFDKNIHLLEVKIKVPEKKTISEIYYLIKKIEDVRTVEIIN